MELFRSGHFKGNDKKLKKSVECRRSLKTSRFVCFTKYLISKYKNMVTITIIDKSYRYSFI